MTTVIGAPIEVERITNPSEDEIDRVHGIFCTQLIKLFEDHKSKYDKNYESVHLEIF